MTKTEDQTPGATPAKGSASDRRKKTLLEPRIQIKTGLAILAASLSCVGVQALVLARKLVAEAETLGVNGDALRAHVPETIAWSALIATLLLVPVSMSMGVQWMFRVVGPLYRFRVYLGDVVAGRVDSPCRIREGDELWHLCDRINVLTAPLHGSAVAPPRSAGARPETRLRVKFCALFVSVATAAVLVQLLVSTNLLMRLAGDLPAGTDFGSRVPILTMSAFQIALVVLVPLTLGMGLLATAGLLRQLRLLRKALDEACRSARGESTVPASDELHGLFVLVREAADAVERGTARPERVREAVASAG